MTPAILSSRRDWLDAFRLAVLGLLALSLFLAPAGVSAGLTLIWLWFVLAWWQRPRPVWRGPARAVVWLALAFALYCMLYGLVPVAAPVAAESRWDAAFSWAQLVVFIPIAYAIGGNERVLLRLLLLALVGLILGTLWRAEWGMIVSDWGGYLDSRPGFGFPALGYALFGGSALIGLLALRQRIWGARAGHRRWWAIGLWGFAFAVVAEAVVITKARGSWLGLVLVAIVALALWYRRVRRQRQPLPGAPLLGGGAVIALLIGINAGEIGDRLGEEYAAAVQLLQGEAPTEQVTSLSLRWHAQWFGLEQWLQRPWLGWGPGASHALMAARGGDGVQDPNDGVLKHLHNSYLELLSQLGLVGLGLWMAMAGLIFWTVWDAQRRGRLSPDLARFLLFALLYLAIWSLFNFRMVNQDFRAYWAMLAGAALSFGLLRQHGVPGPLGPEEQAR